MSEDIIAHIEWFVAYLARQSDKRVRICRTDNGMEHLADIVRELAETGVRPDVVLQETEDQKESSDFRGDSCSASSVEALCSKARSMISAGTSRTALEAVQGHGPDMPRLQSHGIECWALKDVIECRTESKARKGRLIGFEEGLGGYAR